jgi:hypothetical protein
MKILNEPYAPRTDINWPRVMFAALTVYALIAVAVIYEIIYRAACCYDLRN